MGKGIFRGEGDLHLRQTGFWDGFRRSVASVGMGCQGKWWWGGTVRGPSDGGARDRGVKREGESVKGT